MESVYCLVLFSARTIRVLYGRVMTEMRAQWHLGILRSASLGDCPPLSAYQRQLYVSSGDRIVRECRPTDLQLVLGSALSNARADQREPRHTFWGPNSVLRVPLRLDDDLASVRRLVRWRRADCCSRYWCWSGNTAQDWPAQACRYESSVFTTKARLRVLTSMPHSKATSFSTSVWPTLDNPQYGCRMR